jgi:hypothetical protein
MAALGAKVIDNTVTKKKYPVYVSKVNKSSLAYFSFNGSDTHFEISYFTITNMLAEQQRLLHVLLSRGRKKSSL